MIGANFLFMYMYMKRGEAVQRKYKVEIIRYTIRSGIGRGLSSPLSVIQDSRSFDTVHCHQVV